jgi:hypothetical protein
MKAPADCATFISTNRRAERLNKRRRAIMCAATFVIASEAKQSRLDCRGAFGSSQ